MKKLCFSIGKENHRGSIFSFQRHVRTNRIVSILSIMFHLYIQVISAFSMRHFSSLIVTTNSLVCLFHAFSGRSSASDKSFCKRPTSQKIRNLSIQIKTIFILLREYFKFPRFNHNNFRCNLPDPSMAEELPLQDVR